MLFHHWRKETVDLTQNWTQTSGSHTIQASLRNIVCTRTHRPSFFLGLLPQKFFNIPPTNCICEVSLTSFHLLKYFYDDMHTDNIACEKLSCLSLSQPAPGSHAETCSSYTTFESLRIPTACRVHSMLWNNEPHQTWFPGWMPWVRSSAYF